MTIAMPSAGSLKAKRKTRSAHALPPSPGRSRKSQARPYVFIICLTVVIIWAASGPIAGFSDTWQLVINTFTTIITFLMFFLIQNSQNRDNAAIHAKLDELIRKGNSKNRFIGIEHLSDEELDDILEEVEDYAHDLHCAQRDRGEL